ncbi:bifunctional 4-hydroxy-2-oxoglutarate aldolase/2-dehydro-3-deoxy-phosphogluconate aldolase [Microbispora sp. NPDC046933]|uniref:bifunctional 4-hydroxy-2-oxoglutarate aldolase/2-dehydro-3-deoxy-phosphogluconate aldolase n=1 Tax=Microbispora sp. NPDC046933 TaxID=3155618 RepID=UPI0033E96B2D
MAILRSPQSTYVDACIETLIDAGVKSIEVTLTTPDALAILSRWSTLLPADVRLGCGTVMTPSQAEQAVESGAAFIVAPDFSPSVMRTCRDRDIPLFPAAWTSTEVVHAWQAGATAVKLFPASVGGPQFVRQLRGPLPAIPLLPTGGIEIDNAASYILAGADAVGLGGPLLGDALSGGNRRALRQRAQQVLEAVAAGMGDRT